MPKRTSNLVLLAQYAAEAKVLFAAAGFVPLREENVDDDKVRFYFKETQPEECLRLFNSVPREMHAYRMLG
jgi:hypothetical protein